MLPCVWVVPKRRAETHRICRLFHAARYSSGVEMQPTRFVAAARDESDDAGQVTASARTPAATVRDDLRAIRCLRFMNAPLRLDRPVPAGSERSSTVANVKEGSNAEPVTWSLIALPEWNYSKTASRGKFTARTPHRARPFSRT